MLQILRTLGREYSIEILEATNEPRSVTWLSEELDIPIATCYRRVKEFVEVGLLTEEEIKRDNERQRTHYRRSVDRVALDFTPTLSINTSPRTRNRATTTTTATAGVGQSVGASAIGTRAVAGQQSAESDNLALLSRLSDGINSKNPP